MAHPEIEPFRIGKLDVGDGHVLHFEECAPTDRKPVVMIHGGPGGGSNTFMRRLHDPSNYRIVLFDPERAKSTPAARSRCNTTPHLIADMEKLRAHLEIERWQLCGGSWGSTLALAYAEPALRGERAHSQGNFHAAAMGARMVLSGGRADSFPMPGRTTSPRFRRRNGAT